MSVFTFSTKATRPADTHCIERVKAVCDERGMNFSALVVKLIKQWEAEQNEQRAKQD